MTSSPKNNIDYKLPQDAYVAFDALTLRDFIVKRLTDSGNFTDQIYEGSNLSSIIEIVAYSYHVLMFYLNTTSSESMFSQATLYENMNKIVNLVGYKPTGKRTSICTINAIANAELPLGNYTIKKYSYIFADNIPYVFLQDYSFGKNTTSQEELQTLNDSVILYQGTVQQYPEYIASGDEYETLPIVVTNIVDNNTDKFISSGTVSVYVKEVDSGKYFEYSEVTSLYLAGSQDRVYDLRLNENGNYEVKFGNDVFGKKLTQGDEVVIYYLLSDNVPGIIASNSIDDSIIFPYNDGLFDIIYEDTSDGNQGTFVTPAIGDQLIITNPINSTAISEGETVDEIRRSAPDYIASNLRLVTTRDYTSFLTKNLSNIVRSLYVASNDEFIRSYLKYFYDISVDPNKVNRVLLNQVNFADSCDFNNVNVFVVPSFDVTVDNQVPTYMSTSLKNMIVDLTRDLKMINVEVVPRDPVYTTFKLGISNRPTLVPGISNNCRLVVVRENTNKIQKNAIRDRVANIIREFFATKNNSLGGTIRLSKLTSDIISVVGVKYIYTYNSEENIRYNGVSLLGWNPAYPEDDIFLLNQDTELPFYKFPYLGYIETINNYIEVVDE